MRIDDTHVRPCGAERREDHTALDDRAAADEAPPVEVREERVAVERADNEVERDVRLEVGVRCDLRVWHERWQVAGGRRGGAYGP